MSPVGDESGPGRPLLRLRDVCVSLPTARGEIRAVDHVSLEVAPATAVGLVGESGSGKSILLKAILGLLPDGARTSGSIEFDGHELERLRPKDRARVRGRSISFVPQDPMTALNPVRRVGSQIAEGPIVHFGTSRRVARARAVELLEEVGIASPAEVARRYPHELSGGMRQRALIAMALACDPKLILCDEPTTALDVTVQKRIMELLRSVSVERGVALLFVSHDLAVVSELCDEVGVMYAGQFVETGPTHSVIEDPRHAYTWALLRSLPPVEGPRVRPISIGGTPPDRHDLPSGCRFHPRCPVSGPECPTLPYDLRPAAAGRRSSCIHAAVGIPEPVGARSPALPEGART